MNKYFDKWKKKSFFSKFSDIFFILFIVAMIIPGPRTTIMAFVNNIKAHISQPKVNNENPETLNIQDINWQLSDINGNTLNFSNFKGKVVFLNFWATWCGPCLGEMPEIQKLYDMYKNNPNIEFVLVTNENTSVISQFIDRKKYTFPVYTALTNPPNKFSTNSIPTTFLINKNGEILIHKVGAANWSGKKMVETINNALKD